MPRHVTGHVPSSLQKVSNCPVNPGDDSPVKYKIKKVLGEILIWLLRVSS